ncbi:MAG: KOW motif-containing protein, partial [Muribaculaceae bacterium]|nr:KOW motif-containing protein [Muribaculaceae bacterium]
YVIIEANLRDEIIHVIQNLPNVLDFLREREGQPIPMRQSEINRILGKMDEQADGVEAMERFIVGESVKVIDGPFNSFSGIVEEVNDEKKKLKVTVKIFGRRSPLELNYSQVEKEQ